ncbi:MAG: DUF998 domain-containing protein [Candidatus Bathyarchaeota archaeon]|nr:DUF998 domain-containing protein [Candidatus Bathyarchaeota archaeon]
MVCSRKIGAAAGFATPIVAFACILCAIATYPQFSWVHNALSDLGVVSGVTGILFNFGLVASGVLGFVFAVLGLYDYLGVSRLGKVGAGFFAAATVALVLIGVFNEHFSPTHYIVSVAFFSLVPIALFILTCACYLQGKHAAAGFSVIIGLVAAVPWILQLTLEFVPRVAIPETISAAAVSAWAIVLSALMLKEKRR